MIRRPPRATRTDNLFPSTSRFRSPVTVQDLLPAGMRLRAETVRIDGVRVDALVRANGREFAVTLPGIAGARSLLLTYLAESSEERRVGKECVSTFRSRWSPYHSKKQSHSAS